MIQKKRRKIILIFGRTGSGKSYLVNRMLKTLNRYIIVDAMQEYTNGLIFTDLDSFVEYIINNYDPDPKKEMKLIVRFDNDETFEKFFEICFELENYTLVLEEAEIYISAQAKKSNFLKIVRYGRHRSISIIAVARRIPELSNDVKANADEIISYKQIIARDIKYLSEMGFNKVDKLKLYEFETVKY